MRNDDDRYRRDLPATMEEMGIILLDGIRRWHNGGLVYHEGSRKYVENPNFWTVIIQKQDQSLRITVYGEPDSFEYKGNKLSIGKDMKSYSSFKISHISQVNDAISIIRKSYEMKNRYQKIHR